MRLRSQIKDLVQFERNKHFSPWKQWRIKCQVCKKRLKDWKISGYIDEFEKEYICGECWIKENEHSKQKVQSDKIESGVKKTNSKYPADLNFCWTCKNYVDSEHGMYKTCKVNSKNFTTKKPVQQCSDMKFICQYLKLDCKKCKMHYVFTNDYHADIQYLCDMGCAVAINQAENDFESMMEDEGDWEEYY